MSTFEPKSVRNPCADNLTLFNSIMAQLFLCIVPSRVNSDGSSNIRIKITNKNTSAYITTRYRIDNINQWKNGKVVKRPDAELMNHKLRGLLMKYEEALDSLPDNISMSASQIKGYLEAQLNKTDLIKDYALRYIDRLVSNGQKSYASNMGYTLKYLLDCFGEYVTFQQFNLATLKQWEKYLFDIGSSATTVNIRMSHLKALLNAAVNEGFVEYKIFPFRLYKMPAKAVRDICISKDELAKLREATFEGVSAKRLAVARDLFMLSFYCAGINLADLIDAELTDDVLTFVRKKTADKKQGEKNVSITIQPEAREIINKYANGLGKLDLGYHYSEYGQFRSFVTKSLNRIGELLGFEKRLMFYSARKTFCQFGYEIGIPLHILEYAIGQTIKDANNRPIFNYIKIMRKQADEAIRAVIDYSFMPDDGR